MYLASVLTLRAFFVLFFDLSPIRYAFCCAVHHGLAFFAHAPMALRGRATLVAGHLAPMVRTTTMSKGNPRPNRLSD